MILYEADNVYSVLYKQLFVKQVSEKIDDVNCRFFAYKKIKFFNSFT